MASFCQASFCRYCIATRWISSPKSRPNQCPSPSPPLPLFRPKRKPLSSKPTPPPIKATSPLAVKAIKDFRTMLKDGNRMSHNLALTVLSEKEKFDVAMAIYGDMLKRNCPLDCKTYNCVIDGLGKAGKVEDAIHLFNEMAEIGISPDTTTYSNLLNGFCKFHRMDEAFMFLSSFLKKGYVVNLNGYRSMIDGLFGIGRFEEACKYYKNLLEDNILPDLTLYRIMIKAYTEAGRIDDGFGIIKQMSSAFMIVPDSYIYSILFKGLVDAGLWNMAQLFVKDYILEPNFISYSPIQAIMVGWLCKVGFPQEAEEIFEKMVREEMFIKAVYTLIGRNG